MFTTKIYPPDLTIPFESVLPIATKADLLEAAVASIEQAAIQASCETRRLVGQQAQAFTAAALPLCRPI